MEVDIADSEKLGPFITPNGAEPLLSWLWIFTSTKFIPASHLGHLITKQPPF
jgi:hypothetical protein